MDLSLIIPCHNLENYIQPLLSTLHNQNIDGISVEYIFIIDSSTDHTKQIISEWATKERNNSVDIKIIDSQCHNCGLSRNIGLDVASGEYIWFVDGDDWIVDPNSFSLLVDIMRENNLLVLRFDWFSNYIRNNMDWCMVWQYIYRKDFIGGLRFVNVEPGEDLEFNKYLLSKIDYKIPFITNKLYFYNFKRSGSNMENHYKNSEADDPNRF